VSDSSCAAYGSDSTCAVSTLGGKSVRLLGLNPDGDVDTNDRFYVGMKCAGSETSSIGQCPSGQLAVGISGGKVQCASVASAVRSYFASKCNVYLGWRDDCDGCTTSPSKWGRTTQNLCSIGAGTDGSCTLASLGGENVRLYGLNPDGDVDGNDKLYYGFRCE
jgi:hypothetical protein